MDIVLDVLENFHGNVYIEVLSKVVACQHVANHSWLKFSLDFQSTEKLSRGVLQK